MVLQAFWWYLVCSNSRLELRRPRTKFMKVGSNLKNSHFCPQNQLKVPTFAIDVPRTAYIWFEKLVLYESKHFPLNLGSNGIARSSLDFWKLIGQNEKKPFSKEKCYVHNIFITNLKLLLLIIIVGVKK